MGLSCGGKILVFVKWHLWIGTVPGMGTARKESLVRETCFKQIKHVLKHFRNYDDCYKGSRGYRDAITRRSCLLGSWEGMAEGEYDRRGVNKKMKDSLRKWAFKPLQGTLKADRKARKIAGIIESRTIWEEGTEHLKVSVWIIARKEDL